MANLPYDPVQGAALYNATQDFKAMDSAYDSIADNPYLFNARDRGELRDFAEYVRQATVIGNAKKILGVDFGTGLATPKDRGMMEYNSTTLKWDLVAGGVDDKVNFSDTIATSIDVSPAVPFKIYMVDATAGHRVISLPNAVPGDKKWFAVTQVKDGNHVEVTTVGGTQIMGPGTATNVDVFTCGTTLILATNSAGTGYDVVMDNRQYLRIVDTAVSLDLSAGGYESGALYLCTPPVGTNITITLPPSEVSHRGIYAKFILEVGAGGYGTVTVAEPVIGLDEQIVTPNKGFELMDDGTNYHITQDSRPSPGTVALFQFATTAASDIGTYLKTVPSQDDPDYDDPADDATLGTVTGAATLLASFASDPGDLVGTTEQTTVRSTGYIRKTVASAEDAEIYVETYHRNLAGTETLLGTSNVTSDITSNVYELFEVSALIPQQQWIETDRIVTKVYANKLGGAANPVLEMQVGGATPAYTTFAIPASAIAHNSTANIQNAATADVTHGHLTSEQFTALSGGNLLINGDFSENQRTVSGTVVLASGEYGHDRFKAGTSGCTYTFATSAGVTTITISAGSLIQVVETTKPGDHTLSWTGTAQASLDGGTSAVSPVTETLTGGANVSCEWGTGTITGTMLNKGADQKEFVADLPGVNLAKCRRYYRTVKNIGGGVCASATVAAFTIPDYWEMRTEPQVGLTGNLRISDVAFANFDQSGGTAGKVGGAYYNITGFTGMTPGNPCFMLTDATYTNHITLNAEL